MQQAGDGIELRFLQGVVNIACNLGLFVSVRPELTQNGVLRIAFVDARDKPAWNLERKLIRGVGAGRELSIGKLY
jgi:hypothetical protein